MDQAPSTKIARGARYSTVAIILHWLIAAALVFEVVLGLRMEDATGQAKFAIFQLHKSVGITVLLLVALRVVWRLMRRPPALTASGWERGLAQVVHALFYVLLFALPLSGWVIVSTSDIVVPTLLYGLVPWPDMPGLAALAEPVRESWNEASEFVHVNLVNVLYGLFALHVAGALKHHFLDKDGDFARMAPGTRPGKASDPRLIAVGMTALAVAGLALVWQPGGPAEQADGAGTEQAAQVASADPADPALADDAEPEAGEGEGAADPEAVATASPDTPEAADMPLSRWTIEAGSTIRFTTSYGQEQINGGFSRFDGEILFSPDDLGGSQVEITVDTASVSSGDSQRDGTLRSADWFGIGAFPEATFKADRFRKTGAGYVADGSLTIKGVTVPVAVPFTLDIAGNRATMRGSAQLDRLAFGLGASTFAATDEIPAQVRVAIQVNATRRN